MFKIIFTIQVEKKREYSSKKRKKKENTIHDFDFFTKIFWKHVEIIFIIQVGKKKKRKKKERIFTQKKILFMMSIELGNQFELELWMNMSVTAKRAGCIF